MRFVKGISYALFAGLLLSNGAMAAGRGKPKAPAHHDTVIGAVTATSLTIKEDKTERTFTISPFTEITVNGQKSNAGELKPGMLVSVILTDATRVSRIAATTKP